MQIIKEFKFEAAHKLSKSYTCKCQNIHGHSYKALVVIKGEKLNDEQVVVDFTKVKESVDHLIEALDHNLIVHSEDPITPKLIKLANKGHTKLIVCDKNPTAEIIAIWLLQAISHNQPSHLKFAIQLYETATSSASVTTLDDIYRETLPTMTFYTAGRMTNSLIATLKNTTPLTYVKRPSDEKDGFE